MFKTKPGAAVIGVALISILTVLVSGCATRQLQSDFDRSVDFSKYRTYNFYENAGLRDTECKPSAPMGQL